MIRMPAARSIAATTFGHTISRSCLIGWRSGYKGFWLSALYTHNYYHLIPLGSQRVRPRRPRPRLATSRSRPRVHCEAGAAHSLLSLNFEVLKNEMASDNET